MKFLVLHTILLTNAFSKLSVRPNNNFSNDVRTLKIFLLNYLADYPQLMALKMSHDWASDNNFQKPLFMWLLTISISIYISRQSSCSNALLKTSDCLCMSILNFLWRYIWLLCKSSCLFKVKFIHLHLHVHRHVISKSNLVCMLCLLCYRMCIMSNLLYLCTFVLKYVCFIIFM